MAWASSRGGAERLSVFIYHRVLPEPDPLFPGEVDRVRFTQHLRWITRWFKVLPLAQAVQMLRDGTLPAGSAAITFDDGYADNVHHAAPVLQDHGATATLFVATGFLDGGCMWNDRVIEAIRASRKEHIHLPNLLSAPVPLTTIEARQQAIRHLLGRIKYLPHIERLEAVDSIVRAAGAQGDPQLMLSTAELRRWCQLGNDVGGHTVTHPILSSLDDHVAREEISAGRARLQELLDTRVGLFAYPNGKPGDDYLPKHVDMVRDAGFDAAFSTTWGAAARGANAFELPRFTPWDRGRLRFGARLMHNLLARGAAVARMDA